MFLSGPSNKLPSSEGTSVIQVGTILLKSNLYHNKLDHLLSYPSTHRLPTYVPALPGALNIFSVKGVPTPLNTSVCPTGRIRGIQQMSSAITVFKTLKSSHAGFCKLYCRQKYILSLNMKIQHHRS